MKKNCKLNCFYGKVSHVIGSCYGPNSVLRRNSQRILRRTQLVSDLLLGITIRILLQLKIVSLTNFSLLILNL